MIKILIEKELKSILLSPKFASIFAVCSILIVLSVYIGIQEYRGAMAYYETNNSLVLQERKDIKSYRGINTSVTRRPDPMQIFVSGIHNDIGKQAYISQSETISLNRSNYEDNSIFAVFRSMDLMFIFQIVLSLFAVLFTYDAINGEREKGTLKLSFANPVPRSIYIIAKLAGSWFGLVIPLLIPLLLGMSMVLIYNVPMTGDHWLRLGMFLSLSFLYFSFFICLGVLVSSMTRESSNSFLYLLVIWISFVLLIPGGGVMVAGKFVPVQTTAEISAMISKNYRELYDQYNDRSDKRYQELRSKIQNLPPDLSHEERKKRTDELYAGLSKQNDEDSNRTSGAIEKYDALLNEDWRNKKAVREKLGFSLSRISPASAYQLSAMDIAETNISLKNRHEDQLRNYRDIFNRYRSKKEKESGGDSFQSLMSGDRKPLDLSDMPEFRYEKTGIISILEADIRDIGIISIYILLAAAGAVTAFLKYDVR